MTTQTLHLEQSKPFPAPTFSTIIAKHSQNTHRRKTNSLALSERLTSQRSLLGENERNVRETPCLADSGVSQPPPEVYSGMCPLFVLAVVKAEVGSGRPDQDQASVAEMEKSCVVAQQYSATPHTTHHQQQEVMARKTTLRSRKEKSAKSNDEPDFGFCRN